MVKLMSARGTRQYGVPPLDELGEVANSYLYVLAAMFLLAGSIVSLPQFDGDHVALWMLFLGVVLLVIVNVHDLYAQLAGFDFQLPLLTLDPQLALVETLAPLLHTIGALLYATAFSLLLYVTSPARGDTAVEGLQAHARALLVAAPVFFLLGAMDNACQVYERGDLSAQTLQNAAALPLIVASSLYLAAGLMLLQMWPLIAELQVRATVGRLFAAGSGCILVAAIVNLFRVVYVQQAARCRTVAVVPTSGPLSRTVRVEEVEEEVAILVGAPEVRRSTGGAKASKRKEEVEVEEQFTAAGGQQVGQAAPYIEG
eukprot:SM000034S12742  [mRNA]  locus=s34:485827:487571:+ [translate_table: standard]